MREWLKNWLFKEEIEKQKRAERDGISIGSVSSVEEAGFKPQPKIRIGTMEVMNGKLLEVSSYQRNNHGPDWKTEYYILDESQPLAEQIAVVMTMRGMGV
jgi:hypothetical protein